MWETQEYDFGVVNAKTRLAATFTYRGDKTIKELKADCGCTIPAAVNNQVVVNYTTPDVPAHLQILKKDFYDLKTIRVVFTDNSVDILKIKAVVKCQEQF